MSERTRHSLINFNNFSACAFKYFSRPDFFVMAMIVLGSFFWASASVGSPVNRERISLDDGWRFTKDDPGDVGDQLSYPKIKDWILPTSADLTTNLELQAMSLPATNPILNVAYARPEFDDSQWRLLNLPHDWGIEGPFQQEYPGETGKLPWWGVAWYRKHLELPAADQGRCIFMDVDGAMAYASVWVNGHLAGGWPYGYASWRVDLTPFVNFGADNVIAIRLDNPQASSRWYPGGGIYRNVWLVKTAPVHVAHWGTYVTTPEVNEKSADLKLSVEVDNTTDNGAKVMIKNDIYLLKEDGSRGKLVASLQASELSIAPRASATSEGQATITSPVLWTLEKPRRYVVETGIEQEGATVDEYETPFGIRTTAFTIDGGFFLNGQHVKLNGVCDHHDLGALGTAINRRALQRQLEILRAVGVNAIRTSHNPPAPELLDLCDQMGFLVMDEAFDCWVVGKTHNDYHKLYREWHEQDLRALVRRDRNHPCVILWSSGNEVPDQDKPDGPALAAEHRAIIHSEDDTRPVTAAVSSYNAGFSGFQTNFDVFGWNYKPMYYTEFRRANPNIPFFGSETASTVSSRGVYIFPTPTLSSGKQNRQALLDFQVSSYDVFVPGWATSPDAEFSGEDLNPFVAGEFVWTGFDYLGEPTPYNANATNLLNFSDPAERARAQQELQTLGTIDIPSRSSYFGIVDLAGFKKDRFYLYQSVWRPELPMAHILPHWNWPDRIGQITPVWVYTSGDAAELFLNGKSLGMKQKGPQEYRLCWNDVVYEPGVLKVVAYKNGKKWAKDTVKTTGAPTKVILSADRRKIAADGLDLSYVTVTIADKEGLTVPRSHNHVRFTIDGPGEIVATDNGDATSFESFQAPER
ncbi:MAG TPA: beta-galactosidase GalB, partial [Candidatus Acidoferrum sp.]|nr:beta-galactosidase GalB [Candidatus Acidoferrum sp.]